MNLKAEIRKTERELEKAQPKPINHILHLILTILTGGLWVIIWILLAMNFNTSVGRLEKKLEKLYERLDND